MLFMVSFAVQKFLSLIRSHLFIFIVITLGGESKKISLQFKSESVLPMFSSVSFRVSGLIFRYLIHFEFIFVHGVKKCSNFILLHVAVQFPQHHLLKRLYLPQGIFFTPMSKVGTYSCMGLFLGFLSCSFGLYFCFCASTTLP